MGKVVEPLSRALGGTKVEAALVDIGGHVVGSCPLPTEPKKGPKASLVTSYPPEMSAWAKIGEGRRLWLSAYQGRRMRPREACSLLPTSDGEMSSCVPN